VPSGVSLILKHLYSLTPNRDKSCGQSPRPPTAVLSLADVRCRPLCRTRLSANLFCSLVAQPILAVHPLRQFPLSLYKKLPLAYDVFRVIQSIDPVAPASLAGVFAFGDCLHGLRLLFAIPGNAQPIAQFQCKTSSLQSVLAKVYQNKRLQLPLETPTKSIGEGTLLFGAPAASATIPEES
jgi:hypothetical protein